MGSSPPSRTRDSCARPFGSRWWPRTVPDQRVDGCTRDGSTRPNVVDRVRWQLQGRRPHRSGLTLPSSGSGSSPKRSTRSAPMPTHCGATVPTSRCTAHCHGCRACSATEPSCPRSSGAAADLRTGRRSCPGATVRFRGGATTPRGLGGSPSPAPSTVFPEPLPAVVVTDERRVVSIDDRGVLDGQPALFSPTGRPRTVAESPADRGVGGAVAGQRTVVGRRVSPQARPVPGRRRRRHRPGCSSSTATSGGQRPAMTSLPALSDGLEQPADPAGRSSSGGCPTATVPARRYAATAATPPPGRASGRRTAPSRPEAARHRRRALRRAALPLQLQLPRRRQPPRRARRGGRPARPARARAHRPRRVLRRRADGRGGRGERAADGVRRRALARPHRLRRTASPTPRAATCSSSPAAKRATTGSPRRSPTRSCAAPRREAGLRPRGGRGQRRRHVHRADRLPQGRRCGRRWRRAARQLPAGARPARATCSAATRSSSSCSTTGTRSTPTTTTRSRRSRATARLPIVATNNVHYAAPDAASARGGAVGRARPPQPRRDGRLAARLAARPPAVGSRDGRRGSPATPAPSRARSSSPTSWRSP